MSMLRATPASLARTDMSTTRTTNAAPIQSRHGWQGARPSNTRVSTRVCFKTSHREHYSPTVPVVPREVFRELGSIGDDTFNRANMLHSFVLDKLDARGRLLPVLSTLLAQGLSSRELQLILVRHPQTFSYSQDDVQDVLAFLANDVKLSPEQIRTVITKYPQVFSYNVKAHLKPQVAYLISLGVDRELLPSFVYSRPMLLGEGIETVIKFLRACGVPRQQLGQLLRSYPIDYCCRFIVRNHTPGEDGNEDSTASGADA